MNWKNWICSLMLLGSLMACEKNTSELGMESYAAGNYQKAIELFNDYLVDHPKDHQTIYNRGRAYEELEELEKAINDFKAAAKISPKEPTYWISSGICNFKMKKFDATISNMNALLEFNERNTDALVLKGRACSYAGKAREAMKAFDLAIKYDKNCGDAYLHRGLLRASAHDLKTCDDLKTAKLLKAKGADKAVKKHCD
ncbi:MAG: tetratricopeptide repeat protein [Flammeovirgaceae bacterium]